MKSELAVYVAMVMLFFFTFSMEAEFEVEKYRCVEHTIDRFDNCLELGYERVGFLAGNYYLLCDGVKVVNQCIEKENYTEIKNMSVMDCVWGGCK